MITKLNKKIPHQFIFFGFLLLGIFAVTGNADAYTYSGVLKLGSTGAGVVSLQNKLGVSPASGSFDYTTRGKVVAFQISHKLVADGIVGPATGKALASYTPSTQVKTPTVVSSPYPIGCTAATEFSAVTGKPCKPAIIPLPAGCASVTDYYEYSTVTGLPCTSSIAYPDGCYSSDGFSITNGKSCAIPVGCTSTSGYNILTGKRCDETVSDNQSFPEGCTSTSGYSALTGASCSTGMYYGTLSGDAGSLVDVKFLPAYANRGAPEDYSDFWFAGYTLVAADGSDLAIDSVKISLSLTGGSGSNNINKYAERISIWNDGNKVATANVSDFSRNGGVYSKSITLSGAIVGSDQESNLFFSVDTIPNIDSSNVQNTWTVTLSEVRYRDASGAVVADSSTGAIGSDGVTSFYFIPVTNNY